jgi:hypothetical protein
MKKEKVYNFLPYKKAVAFARSLHLKNQYEWQQYTLGKLKGKGKRPKNIPAAPYSHYSSTGDWINWASWLGTKNKIHNQKDFLPYEKAKKIVHSFGFKSREEWEIFQKELMKGNEYSRLISRRPEIYFLHAGWKGWADWLGADLERFFSYEQAKKIVQQYGFTSSFHWQKADKSFLPERVPRYPNSLYMRRGTWVSWEDFLGVKITTGPKKGSKRKKGWRLSHGGRWILVGYFLLLQADSAYYIILLISMYYIEGSEHSLIVRELGRGDPEG